jgi:hypothetical protein
MGCGIKKGPGIGGRSAFSFQFSVFSFQFSVFSFQFSVFGSLEIHQLVAGRLFIVHRSSFSLLPAPRSLLNQSNCSAPHA